MLAYSSPVQVPLIKKIQNYTFKFSDVLGQGNFSKVYKGFNEITNQVVAIKVVQLNSLKSPKLEELLFSEIEILKKLNHPNILKCYEVFSSNRNCYIITQLCNQGDLETKLRSRHHFKQQQADRYISDIFKGLKYLAQNHIIHRDLKIANIFLHNGTAKIADFGFSKFTQQNFKDINIGSPIYMSPEGFLNYIYGPKTDVWAFGIFIYELLHGKTPFSHCKDEFQLRRQIVIPIAYSSLRSQLSFGIRDLILKCLEINVDQRISIEQLGQLEHMKKILKSQTVIEIRHKPSSSKKEEKYHHFDRFQKNKEDQHYSVEKNRLHIKSYHQRNSMNLKDHTRHNNKIATPVNFLNWRQNKPEIKLTYRSPYKNAQRPFSAQRKPQLWHNKGSRQKQQNQIVKVDRNNRDKNASFNHNQLKVVTLHQNNHKLLPATLSFKDSVNILHYCRLIYKYLKVSTNLQALQYLKTQPVLAGWILKILQQMQHKINTKQIFYEDDTDFKKQSKLKQVTSQYHKKYSVDLNKSSFSQQYSYSAIITLLESLVEEFQQSLKTRQQNMEIQLAHFAIIMLQSTNLLRKCAKQTKFYQWGQYQEIEDFLSQNKKLINFATYTTLKARVLKKI